MKKIACIPKEYLVNLKDGVAKGDFDIAKMIEMTSSERRSVFEKHVPKEYAKFANEKLERAIISKKKDALLDWANLIFKGEKKVRKNDVIDKIEYFIKRGVISEHIEDAFYEDIIADELGIYITQEELGKVNFLANKMRSEIKKFKIAGHDVELPSVKWFKYRREMLDYINEINPTPIPKILSSTVSRTFLLASFKSPLVNIAGNTAQGTMTALARRLESKTFRGLNPDLVKSFVKENYKLFKETGYDSSRMESLTDDAHILGEKIISSQGEGRTRKFARFMEKTIFDISLGRPDVVAASMAFGDSLNLNSTSIAKKEGLSGDMAKARAREIMFDAMGINPKTTEGKVLRGRAMQEAYYSTFTNDSYLSKITLSMRELLNAATGNVRLGDQIIPFAKTPANVVATGIQHSGLMFPVDARNIIKGKKTGDIAMVRRGMMGLTRGGLGIMAVIMLSSLLDPDDYVSEYADYFPKERQLMAAEGATYNSLKIGNKWISLDYFGPLAAGLVGYMNAKKHGNNIPDAIAKYYFGAMKQAFKIPGFQELSNILVGTAQSSKKLMEGEYKDIIIDARDGFANFIAPRVIPAVMGDLAAVIDDKERKKRDYKDYFKVKVPLWRETLEPRITMFGTELKTQPGLAPLLYGSRVKISEKNKLTEELNRLSESNQLPSISSIEYSSKRIEEIKQVMPKEEFTEMLKDYGTKLNKNWNKIIERESYKKLPAEKQRALLDRVKNKVLDMVYYKYLKKHVPEIKELRKNK